MSAKADGTGQPSWFQQRRIDLANFILGDTLWKWWIVRMKIKGVIK